MSSSCITVEKNAQQQEAALGREVILNRILQLLGPGQGLLVMSVAKQWHSANKQTWRVRKQLRTSYAAVLASESRLQLACSCGFRKVLRAASSRGDAAEVIGREAGLNVLQLALSLGLEPDSSVLRGAVLAGALDKAQFLWPLVRDQCIHWEWLGFNVADGGSTEVAQFLTPRVSNLINVPCAQQLSGAI